MKVQDQHQIKPNTQSCQTSVTSSAVVSELLNLYACLGVNRYLWDDVAKEAGIILKVTAIELDPELARMYKERFPNDTVIVADAHEYLIKNYKKFNGVWSSPPCPSHSRLDCVRNRKISLIPFFDVSEIEFDGHLSRPKSLKGLEKNNGWTKIENESDLPTIGEYYTIASFDNSIVEREFPHPKFSLEFNKEWWLKYITHYQQIIKPECSPEGCTPSSCYYSGFGAKKAVFSDEEKSSQIQNNFSESPMPKSVVVAVGGSVFSLFFWQESSNT